MLTPSSALGMTCYSRSHAIPEVMAFDMGAYGNFGGAVSFTIYFTICSLTNAQNLFATMAIAALICASLCAFFLIEPKRLFADHYGNDALAVASPYPKNNVLDPSKSTASFVNDCRSVI